jgi:biotin operon repressor
MYYNLDLALSGVKRAPPSDCYESLLTDLEGRLERVERQILYLQQLLKAQSRNVYPGIKLTPNQETIVNRLLATNGICSKEQLYEALYLSREGYKPDPKILREIIRVVRKQLRSHGIEIKTEFGKGYTMPRESKAKLRKLAVPRGKRAGST